MRSSTTASAGGAPSDFIVVCQESLRASMFTWLFPFDSRIGAIVGAQTIPELADRSHRTILCRTISVAVARRAARWIEGERAALRPTSRARVASAAEPPAAEHLTALAISRIALDAADAAVVVGVRRDLFSAAAAREIVTLLPLV